MAAGKSQKFIAVLIVANFIVNIIEKEIEEVVPDPTDTRLRKKQQFRAGAFLKRERLDSEGRRSLRYQRMPIRV